MRLRHLLGSLRKSTAATTSVRSSYFIKKIPNGNRRNKARYAFRYTNGNCSRDSSMRERARSRSSKNRAPQIRTLRLVPIHCFCNVLICSRPELNRYHESCFAIRAFTSSQGIPVSSPASISSSLSSKIRLWTSVTGMLDGSWMRLSQSDSISSSLSSAPRLSISIAGRDTAEL